MAKVIKEPVCISNTRQFFQAFGAVEFSEDDADWQENDAGEREARYQFRLGQELVNHLGGRSTIPYQAAVTPQVLASVTKCDALGVVGWSVDVESARDNALWEIVVKAWGTGTLQALRVQWTALTVFGG
jgi:hypothetical protein